eukprot:SAG11_NODE_10564_length_821_cov_0.922438_2_plen_71_part_01
MERYDYKYTLMIDKIPVRLLPPELLSGVVVAKFWPERQLCGGGWEIGRHRMRSICGLQTCGLSVCLVGGGG